VELLDVALGADRGHAALAGRHDDLPEHRVGHLARREHMPRPEAPCASPFGTAEANRRQNGATLILKFCKT
jgi:hypothetical protein